MYGFKDVYESLWIPLVIHGNVTFLGILGANRVVSESLCKRYYSLIHLFKKHKCTR